LKTAALFLRWRPPGQSRQMQRGPCRYRQWPRVGIALPAAIHRELRSGRCRLARA
jgi:hypothetical protein